MCFFINFVHILGMGPLKLTVEHSTGVYIRIHVFSLLLYIAVNTPVIEYNINATCFDLQKSSSG